MIPVGSTLEVLGSHSQFPVSMCVHGSNVYTVMLVMMRNNVLFPSALQVVMSPTAVTEGQSVTLTCNSKCPAHANPAYIWITPVTSQPTISGNTLTLNSVSKRDEGRYSCALKGHEHPSPSVCKCSLNWPRHL